MNPNDNNLQNVNNPLSVMQDGERVLCEIKRHPIGILGVYLSAAIVIVGAITAALLIPNYVTTLGSQSKVGLALGATILSVIALLYAYVASVVYKGNRWILTNDSLTQVTQDGLFRKHSSQLSLANLEDVTAEQNGIFPSMFGYGILKAETAGERSKFIFLFCPKPNDYAKQIIAAREAFIAQDPAAAARANDKLNVPNGPVPYSQQPSPVPPVQPDQNSPVPPQPPTPRSQPPAGPGTSPQNQ